MAVYALGSQSFSSSNRRVVLCLNENYVHHAVLCIMGCFFTVIYIAMLIIGVQGSGGGQLPPQIRAKTWDFSGKTIISITFLGKLFVCPPKMNRPHTPMMLMRLLWKSV